MFTSMSTVGFGDFHPKSDFERLVCTFILIFGVAIFSMIMWNFVAIIETFRTFNDDLDEGEELSRFLACFVNSITKIQCLKILHVVWRSTSILGGEKTVIRE